MPHEVADASKKGSDIADTFGKTGGGQRSILPLKIVLGRAYKIEDLFDRPVNHRADI
jgi:hypothetical protein